MAKAPHEEFPKAANGLGRMEELRWLARRMVWEAPRGVVLHRNRDNA
jgi:hypothetical protein